MSRCITYTSLDHPKHILVKKIMNLGWSNFELSYASRSLSDAGWTITNTSIEDNQIFGEWLGFTIKDAIKTLSSKKEYNPFIK